MDNIFFLLAGLCIGLLAGIIIMGLNAAAGRTSGKTIDQPQRMNLAGLLMCLEYDQVLHIYVRNTFDQNVPLVEGTQRQYIDYEEDDVVFHLNDLINVIRIVKDGSLEIILQDEHYEERLETQYDAKYVAKWDALDPQTRPYKHSIELPSEVMK